MRDSFDIEGLSGQKTLSGEIPVRGAKNAALKALAATLLFESPVTLTNMPRIEDVSRMLDILRAGGATVSDEDHTVVVDTSSIASHELSRDIAKRIRASIVLTGPMLARMGKVSFPFPGGCVLGERPIDLFLDGFKAMGCEVLEEGEQFTVTAKDGKLRGADIFFPIVSVTGTETLLMAATRAQGETVLRNAAMEPEIVSLAEFLNACGARITGAGTPTIRIEGVATLTATKPYVTLPDRIEAGSFIIFGALAAKELRVTNCVPEHVEALTTLLTRSGVPIHVEKDAVVISGNTKPNKEFKSINVRTHEYPGFPTDMQAPMGVFLTQVSGESTVFETIFDGRLSYADALVRMGADIVVMNPHRMLVRGPRALTGKELEGPDLRAGLAYLMAASIAKGHSTITNAYVVDRGYERIEERLRPLGLSITRTSR